MLFDDLIPEHIRTLEPYVPAKPIEEIERTYGIRSAVKLASNENPWGPSPKVSEAISEVVSQLHRYPDDAMFDLRQAIGRRFDVQPENLVFGNGSNDMIDLVVRVCTHSARNVGNRDHVVIANPSFRYYRVRLDAYDLDVSEVPLRNGVEWNVDDLLAAVKPSTRLLFVTNPNNPSGTILSPAQLDDLVKRTPTHVVLVVDEAYAEYSDPQHFRSAFRYFGPNGPQRKGLVVLRTFSKAYGLAGIRVGFAAVDQPLADAIEKVRIPFNVNVLAQRAAMAALADTDHLDHVVRRNREEMSRLANYFNQRGFKVVPSEANFMLVDVSKSPFRNGANCYEALLRKGVIIRPMSGILERYMRISIGTPEENDVLMKTWTSLTADQSAASLSL